MIKNPLRLSALRLFILLVSCLCTVQVFAQKVNTRVSTDSVTIGEVFEYALTIQVDQEYQRISFPDTNSFPSSLELIERQQFKLSEFSDSLVYNLQYFGTNDLEISTLPVTIFLEDDSITVYTDPVLVNFKTVVAEGDTTIKAMKPIFDFPRPWWPWILAGLALAGFLLWWFKFRKVPDAEEEPKQEIEPFYNPLKELEKELMDIKENSEIAQTKDFKLFYSEVGDAIRTYFEDLYNIPALESTSSELLRYLDAYGVDDTLTDKTRIILRKADLVKFAKFTPTLEDAWNTHENALEFLEKAKLTDSARISRLKVKYNEQFIQTSTQTEKEDA
ncbi:MAG: hypothetical protein CL670_11150 [Balneola sp.]|jgi:hypothetical protein|nr:hypothetical protein [Balneola sp.]MBE79702.1 hypothetical protein [Balneola sp.]HBX67719.1 hypothetical protein [Balneolaceae bacterium]|tara:strand:- start:796 stop:1791 length:996 start_codon:yes stop_codon:yes gene_type:complete